MPRGLRPVLSISALLFAAGYVLAQGDEAPLTPTGPTNSLDVARIGPDTYRLTMNGPDPWVVLEGAPEAFDHAEMHVIGFEYVCPEGLDSFAVYFGPPMGNNTVVSQGPVPPAADWTVFALDLSTVPTWRETIHEFRLDPGNDPEAVTGGQTFASAQAADDLLDEIDSVLESNAETFVRSFVQKGGQ